MNKIWKLNEKKVCTVTHPQTPNFSGHSRGRKIHLAKDDKVSVCNMLIDSYVYEGHLGCCVDNGKCKICFGNAEVVF